jgi:membrane protein DedA with SNARE-associated domain
MLATLTHLVTTFGYAIVAVFILLEYTGLPIPGETALLVAAGFAGAGKLSITTLICIAAGSAFLGYACSYWLGMLFGKGFVERWGRYIGLDQKRTQKMEGFFTRHGALTVFIGRFVSVLRAYIALFAGISRMPYIPFMIFNALGAIAWALIFGTMGYLFGQNLDEVEHFIHIFGWGALLGIVVIAAGWYLRRWVSSPVREALPEQTGLRGAMRRLLAGSALVATGTGRPRLSRLSVSILYGIGLVITALAIVFVSTTTHGLSDFDPLVRFEDMVSIAIDKWLTPRQSLVFLSIAKFGSALSVGIGLATAFITIVLNRRLYMFAMLFGLIGGETLNALLAFLNRGESVFVSSHLSVRIGYLLAFDNIIAPVIVFGMLAYFIVLSMKQLTLVITVIIAFSLPVMAIVASSFLCGIHGGIEFFEELLSAIIWLWICIGLMQFIRLRQERHALQQQIAEGSA